MQREFGISTLGKLCSAQTSSPSRTSASQDTATAPARLRAVGQRETWRVSARSTASRVPGGVARR
jgi:hypothetical protein